MLCSEVLAPITLSLGLKTVLNWRLHAATLGTTMLARLTCHQLLFLFFF